MDLLKRVDTQLDKPVRVVFRSLNENVTVNIDGEWKCFLIKVDYEEAISETVECNYLSLPLIPGPCLNIKTVLSTHGDFHVKDKTAVRTSYL